MADDSQKQQADKSGNILSRLIAFINNFQQRHTVPGFLYAVIKKYGDDEAAYQGALITYYGFLSIFPLLIVATSFIELLARNNDELRQRFVESFNNYFPVIGDQLQSSIHSPSKSGVALLIGTIIALLGARGGAAALQHALNQVWHVPRPHRSGFPKSILQSLSIIVVGGFGLLSAAALSSVATSLGHGLLFKIIPMLISTGIMFLTFLFVFDVGSDARGVGRSDYVIAAWLSAIGIQILQLLGVYYIKHELGSLKSLYSTFAIVLGLLAWIYLQVQIVMYALEAATVRSRKLWPRSLDDKHLTDADRKAYEMYAQKDSFLEREDIDVTIP